MRVTRKIPSLSLPHRFFPYTASGLGIEILDGNMRPVKLNDLHAGMQWIPLVPDQNNILPYSARLKSTQKSVNPGLVSASATFTLEFQ